MQPIWVAVACQLQLFRPIAVSLVSHIKRHCFLLTICHWLLHLRIREQELLLKILTQIARVTGTRIACVRNTSSQGVLLKAA